MRRSVVLVLLLVCNVTWACVFTPSWFKRSHVSLVDEAKSIILIKASAAGTGCELQVVRVLKGSEADLTSVKCRAQDVDVSEDFAGHQKRLFWSNSIGRIAIDGDCEASPPTFKIGATYLALLGVAPDSKQFEQIDNTDDRWLEFVQARIELMNVGERR